jgi:hypothetical protein
VGRLVVELHQPLVAWIAVDQTRPDPQVEPGWDLDRDLDYLS